MSQILLVGYDYADNIAALSTGAATLAFELAQKNFAVGLEKFSPVTDLDELFVNFDKRIYQITHLAYDTFHLSWEQLLKEEAALLNASSTRAVKPLVMRAKLLHFQQTVLKNFQNHQTPLLLGIDSFSSIAELVEYLSDNDIKRAVLLSEKESLFSIKSALNALKVSLETFFLHSDHYLLTEEMEEKLKHAHITCVSTTQFYFSSFVGNFVQKIGKSLDEQTRLATSMKALGKSRMSSIASSKTMLGQPFASSVPNNISDETSSLSERMKSTLKEFRNIFNNGESSGLPTTTIVGDRNNDDDDE